MKLTPQILAMYIGCPVKCDDKVIRTMVGVNQVAIDPSLHRVQTRISDYWEVYWQDLEDIKPILRRLEDMTEGERLKSGIVSKWGMETNVWEPSEFVWLLSKAFDLFGLIDSGEAVDAKTLNP